MEVAAQELGPVIGHAAAKQEFLAAAATGKLHHGWLLRGPRGVGKAKLALQFAAHLLGGGDGSLSTNAESHIGRLISGGNHPDLRVIRRPVDDKGKQKSEIPVDSIRELSEFFSLRPAMGGWRVAIIDAVDELNRFGANAILKTLEEPPSRAVLFLISHGEQMLLPTVRSRCRVLRCGSLTETETLQALAQAGLDNAKAAEIARLAPGRPGRAMQLEGSDAAAASDAVVTALRNLGGSDARSLHDALGLAAKSEASLAAAMEALRFNLQRRAANESDPVLAGDWASAALDVMRIGAEADALNQDRAQTVAAALARVGRVRTVLMLFDTHVNLHAEQFAADLAEVLARARAAGVTRFVTICDRLDRYPAVKAIAHANDDITCTVGVHPHYAKDFWSLESKTLVDEARDPKVVGIGETGLDQHYGYSDIALQERSFVEHIHAARETGLVLVVHTREADDLTGDILEREFKRGPFRILMHCYTGGARLAERALDLDARFSVSGILSFKAAQDVRDVTAKVPLDRIILETDCPYLAPTPHRGRRNEPAYLVDVCRAFAAHRGMTFEEAAELTTKNAIELFREGGMTGSKGRLQVRILGCGSSGGVPRVGNDWGVCDPAEPRNRRSRCSILVRHWAPGQPEPTLAIVDTSPDMREQLLAARIDRLDAVVLSHEHADQCHGLDDVRALVIRHRRRMPVWMSAHTAGIIGRRFDYCFEDHGGYPAILEALSMEAGQAIRIPGPGGDLEMLPLDQDHGFGPSNGFRVGRFGYCNDVVRLPDETLDRLAGVDTLVVDALRYTVHPSHANVEQALAWIARVKPRRAILTNLHVDLDYRKLRAELPEGVEPAFDGMELEIG